MESKPLLPNEFQLIGIQVLESSIKYEPGEGIEPIPAYNAALNFEIGWGAPVNNQIDQYPDLAIIPIKFGLLIQPQGEKVQNLNFNAKFSFQFSFQVPDYNGYLKRNLIEEMGDQLKRSLLSIIYSTSRGIILEKSSFSPLGQFMLPIIDVGLLIQNPNQQ